MHEITTTQSGAGEIPVVNNNGLVDKYRDGGIGTIVVDGQNIPVTIDKIIYKEDALRVYFLPGNHKSSMLAFMEQLARETQKRIITTRVKSNGSEELAVDPE